MCQASERMCVLQQQPGQHTPDSAEKKHKELTLGVREVIGWEGRTLPATSAARRIIGALKASAQKTHASAIPSPSWLMGGRGLRLLNLLDLEEPRPLVALPTSLPKC